MQVYKKIVKDLNEIKFLTDNNKEDLELKCNYLVLFNIKNMLIL